MAQPTYTPSEDVFLTADERLDIPDAIALGNTKNQDIRTLMQLMTEPPADGLGRVFFGWTPSGSSGSLVLTLGTSGHAALAVDNVGNLLYQPAGGGAITLTLTPNQTNYVYAFYAEVPGDQDNRKFINETTQIETQQVVPIDIFKVVAFIQSVTPMTTVASVDAYGNSVTRNLVLLATAITNSSGITNVSQIDARRLWGIDANRNAQENLSQSTEQITGTITGLPNADAMSNLLQGSGVATGEFSFLTALAAALSIHAAGNTVGNALTVNTGLTPPPTGNWFDFTKLGNLAEVFAARGIGPGAQPNLNARISENHDARGYHTTIDQVASEIDFASTGLATLNVVGSTTPANDVCWTFRQSDGALILTLNAEWNDGAGVWNPVTLGAPAGALYFMNGGSTISAYVIPSTPLTWIDPGGWGAAVFTITPTTATFGHLTVVGASTFEDNLLIEGTLHVDGVVSISPGSNLNVGGRVGYVNNQPTSGNYGVPAVILSTTNITIHNASATDVLGGLGVCPAAGLYVIHIGFYGGTAPGPDGLFTMTTNLTYPGRTSNSITAGQSQTGFPPLDWMSTTGAEGGMTISFYATGSGPVSLAIQWPAAYTIQASAVLVALA